MPVATSLVGQAQRHHPQAGPTQEALNSPGPHARSPPSQVARLRADVRATPVDHPGLKH